MIIGSAGAGVFTPEGFAEALEKFGESMRPAILRAMKRVARVPRLLAVQRFTSQGVGKGIFGKNNSGAFRIIKTGAVATQGGTFVLSLELRGFAAMQDQGGRTKPHWIVPKNRKALRLKSGQGVGGHAIANTFLLRGAAKSVASNLGVFRFGVHHPGANVPRHPFAADAMRAAAPRIQQEIDRELCKFTQNGVRIASSSVAA